ncbi:hypothetical protein TKK_0001810 [Trichogramma kaykai]
MPRNELDSSVDGDERLRRLSISVVRTLWGSGSGPSDHEARCANKSCTFCETDERVARARAMSTTSQPRAS